MAVVIRLQGLSAAAGSQDIRKFFTGLTIPDGGVHIIGGERDEAFIIFASDEDARRAMTRSGGIIQGSNVMLLLSSKTEMQNVLEMSSRNAEMEKKRQLQDNAQRRSLEIEANGGLAGITSQSSHLRDRREQNDHLYLFLKGLPFSVTEREIFEFFNGLVVDDIVLMTKPNGMKNGQALVKFATGDDRAEGLKRNKAYIGSRYVEISPTTEKDWLWNLGKRFGKAKPNMEMEGHEAGFENLRDSQYRDRSPQRSFSHSSKEYCVIIENLSNAVEKSDLKRLFWNANVQDDQVLFLVGDNGRRSRAACVLFQSHQDSQEALTKDGVMFLGHWISVQPLSREKMMHLLEAPDPTARSAVEPRRFQESGFPAGQYESEKVWLLVMNLPFDVRKVEIMDFFLEFNIRENDVFLLQDHRGTGTGKALVLFQSETDTRRAFALEGQRFLGSEIMLKCISRSEMREFGVDPAVLDGPLREKRLDRGSGVAAFDEPVYPDPHRPHSRPAASPPHSSRGFDHGPHPRQERDSGSGRRPYPSGPRYDGPTCVRLVNLPLQIRNEEIYDFCYGYNLIPGSASLQYDPDGQPQGSATVVFESRQEAQTAIDELSGRAIGPRRIQLMFV